MTTFATDQINVIEHFVIPMPDGRKLSARVWQPVTDMPLPVILEYIPYRKRDVTRYCDEPMHGYFARQGYVSVRLDLAGSGDSEGVLTDEYALQEQDDAVAAIDWLGRQPWCNGAVGMIGKPWGGFNCLQVAARCPPTLRAITAATLLVGGWVDGYRTALLRMAERLTCPVKCIMGPWAHVYPHDGVPGPQIGFLQEAVRWFDHFLKGVENDVMAEPKLRAFIQDSTPPRTHHEHRDGHWIGERDWPSPEVRGHDLHLTDAGLREAPGPLSATLVPYNLVVGQFGGDWGAIAMPQELLLKMGDGF